MTNHNDDQQPREDERSGHVTAPRWNSAPQSPPPAWGPAQSAPGQTGPDSGGAQQPYPPAWTPPPAQPIQPGWGAPQAQPGQQQWGASGQPQWGQPQGQPGQPGWNAPPPGWQQGGPGGGGAPPPSDPRYYAAPPPPSGTFLEKKKQQGGIWGILATIALALLKWGGIILALLSKIKIFVVVGKLLLTSGTMLLSMWAYASLYGWPFGIGMVMLIFIHECGHAAAAKMRGIPTSFMVFVPFMGAAVFTKRFGKDLEEDAFIGIMGPVVGTAASVLCAVLGLVTDQTFWFALAQWGMIINLFNLLPTAPLDGGWIVPLFSPKVLAFGALLMIPLGFMNPFIWLLGLLSLPRIIGGWRADPATQPYYFVPPAVKWKYGLAYAGLAVFLGICWGLTHGYLMSLRHMPVM